MYKHIYKGLSIGECKYMHWTIVLHNILFQKIYTTSIIINKYEMKEKCTLFIWFLYKAIIQCSKYVLRIYMYIPFSI